MRVTHLSLIQGFYPLDSNTLRLPVAHMTHGLLTSGKNCFISDFCLFRFDATTLSSEYHLCYSCRCSRRGFTLFFIFLART